MSKQVKSFLSPINDYEPLNSDTNPYYSSDNFYNNNDNNNESQNQISIDNHNINSQSPYYNTNQDIFIASDVLQRATTEYFMSETQLKLSEKKILSFFPLGFLLNLFFSLWSWFTYFNLVGTCALDFLSFFQQIGIIYFISSICILIHGFYTRIIFTNSQKTIHNIDNSKQIREPKKPFSNFDSNFFENSIWSSICSLFYLIVSHLFIVIISTIAFFWYITTPESCYQTGPAIISSVKYFLIASFFSIPLHILWWYKYLHFFHLIQFIYSCEKKISRCNYEE